MERCYSPSCRSFARSFVRPLLPFLRLAGFVFASFVSGCCQVSGCCGGGTNQSIDAPPPLFALAGRTHIDLPATTTTKGTVAAGCEAINNKCESTSFGCLHLTSQADAPQQRSQGQDSDVMDRQTHIGTDTQTNRQTNNKIPLSAYVG